MGNAGAELGLPACFKYNTGTSVYSKGGAGNGGECSHLLQRSADICSSPLHGDNSQEKRILMCSFQTFHRHVTVARAEVVMADLVGLWTAGSLTSQSGTQSELGSDLTGLDLTVTNVSPSILRVTIGKAGRYTIPQDTLFKDVDIQSEGHCTASPANPSLPIMRNPASRPCISSCCFRLASALHFVYQYKAL